MARPPPGAERRLPEPSRGRQAILQGRQIQTVGVVTLEPGCGAEAASLQDRPNVRLNIGVETIVETSELMADRIFVDDFGQARSSVVVLFVQFIRRRGIPLVAAAHTDHTEAPGTVAAR